MHTPTHNGKPRPELASSGSFGAWCNVKRACTRYRFDDMDDFIDWAQQEGWRVEDENI